MSSTHLYTLSNVNCTTEEKKQLINSHTHGIMEWQTETKLNHKYRFNCDTVNSKSVMGLADGDTLFRKKKN